MRCTTLAVLGLFLFGLMADAQQGVPGPFSLQIVSLQFEGGKLHMVLQNHGTLPVIAYTYKLFGGQTMTEEFYPPRQSGILPGSQYAVFIPADPDPTKAIPQLNAIGITAVLFADGSYEGLPQDAAPLAAVRKGRLLQAQRLLPLVQDIQASSDASLTATLQDTIASISKMDITLADGSEAKGVVANGIRSVNTHVTVLLRNALKAQDPSRIRAEIAETSAELRTMIDHLFLTGTAIHAIP